MAFISRLAGRRLIEKHRSQTAETSKLVRCLNFLKFPGSSILSTALRDSDVGNLMLAYLRKFTCMCPRPGLALVSYGLQLGIPRLSAQRKPSGVAVRSTVLTESGCTTCMLRELGGGLM